MHFQSILPTINDDLYDLFLSASSGSLSDDWQFIKKTPLTSVSRTLTNINKDILSTLDNGLDYALNANSEVVFTQTASTLSKAEEYLTESLQYFEEAKWVKKENYWENV